MGITVDEATAYSCCASPRFARLLSRAGPFTDLNAVLAEARRVWWHECGVTEWLAAFQAHPRIGQRKPSTDAGSAFAAFSHSEQSAAQQTSTDAVAQDLQRLNDLYYDKFGFIFIICARGRSSPEILAALQERYARLPHEELQAAATEQMKITESRLAAALAASAGDAVPETSNSEAVARMQRRAGQVLAQVAAAHTSGNAAAVRSPITTHVLDTALGCPAENLPLKLLKQDPVSRVWDVIAQGLTNQDGRVANLLPPSNRLSPGRYRMYFDTTAYLQACRTRFPDYYAPVPFYPEVTIDFEITADKTTEHYHIPLLLSPYGYSTYRGS